jgi:N-acetylmuramoyl-L-alanine amidase
MPRIAVYTYQFPFVDTLSGHGSSSSAGKIQRIFVRWDEVQQLHVNESRRLSQDLVEEFRKVSGVSVQEPVAAPVRILRSVDAPAVAVEIGSLTSEVDAQPLKDANFQQQIAKAVADAIEAFQKGRS